MRPYSYKHSKKYRLKTEENPNLRQRLRSPQIKPIVFESEVKSLKNYFQFLQSTFGKKEKINEIVKNIPHQKSINQQFNREATKKRSKSQYIYEPQAFQCIDSKLIASGYDGKDKYMNYRNGFKHSLAQISSTSIKAKFYESRKKRHSYLMQRMNYAPKKTNTAPIQNEQFLNMDQNSQFLPAGRGFSKDYYKSTLDKRPVQKFSAQLMKGISYKKPKHNPIIVKNHADANSYRQVQGKNNQASVEGPWRIIDTAEYNPRYYYSTYR